MEFSDLFSGWILMTKHHYLTFIILLSIKVIFQFIKFYLLGKKEGIRRNKISHTNRKFLQFSQNSNKLIIITPYRNFAVTIAIAILSDNFQTIWAQHDLLSFSLSVFENSPRPDMRIELKKKFKFFDFLIIF